MRVDAHLRENSSSESCVEPSCRDSDMWNSLRGGIQEVGWRWASEARRGSTFRDATLREFGKRELRGSLSERGSHYRSLVTVPGGGPSEPVD